jgi:peptide/nickel transport system ATP-binding protein
VLVMYAGQIVERGPAEELTQHPAHPYTQLLVASAPDPDNLGGGLHSFHPAAGPPPDGTARPPGNGAAPGAGTATYQPAAANLTDRGCPFSPRCPFADDRCRAEDPALLPVSPVRAAACWHLDIAAPEVLAGEERGGG